METRAEFDGALSPLCTVVDGPPVGYADIPPELIQAPVQRIARIRLLALRVRTRIAHDPVSVAEIDTALEELDALEQQMEAT